MPSIDMERNARVAVEDGEVVGYADVGDRTGDGKQLWLDLRAQPAEMPALLDFLEARSRELAAEDAKIKAWSPEENDAWRALLESHGYELDNYSFRMRIDLPEQPPAPEWPAGITVRTYRREEDEQAVYEAHQESFSEERDFERDPFDEWTQWSYREPFDPDLWFIAEDDGQIAGIALCRGERGGDATLGWVSILGVRKPWRRRGLGLALLRHAFGELQKRGRPRVGLGVDGRTTGAVRLYERAGMERARTFVWYYKAL
jgi:mycothiol synthase